MIEYHSIQNILDLCKEQDKKIWEVVLQADMDESGASGEQILKKIGIFQKDLIQEKITEGEFAPNAASTVKKKGSSKPLIDTGRMRQSVNYVIKEKGED